MVRAPISTVPFFRISGKEKVVMLEYDARHNICAHLDLTSKHAGEVAGMIRYLQRSKIFHAISARPKVYRSLINEFWLNASYSGEQQALESEVQGHKVVINTEILRTVLLLKDERDDDPIKIKKTCIMGCFARMKYSGDLGEGMYNKSNVCVQWKYFIHVLIHCLGPRRAGFDVLKDSMQMVAVSLILNKPFSIASMLLAEMRDNSYKKLKGRAGQPKKFLQYPRFIQIVLDSMYPNLKKSEDDVLFLDHMDDDIVSRMKVYKGKKNIPEVKDLFGLVKKENYVAPKNDGWRNPGSDSEIEKIDFVDPTQESDDEDDDQDSDSDDDEDGGKKKKKKKVGEGSSVGEGLLDEPTSEEEMSTDDDSDPEIVKARLIAQKKKEAEERKRKRDEVPGDVDYVLPNDLIEESGDEILLEDEEVAEKRTKRKKSAAKKKKRPRKVFRKKDFLKKKAEQASTDVAATSQSVPAKSTTPTTPPIPSIPQTAGGDPYANILFTPISSPIITNQFFRSPTPPPPIFPQQPPRVYQTQQQQPQQPPPQQTFQPPQQPQTQFQTAFSSLPSFNPTPVRLPGSSHGVYVSDKMWNNILNMIANQQKEIEELKNHDLEKQSKIDAMLCDREFYKKYFEQNAAFHDESRAMIVSLQSSLAEIKKEREAESLERCRQDELRRLRRDETDGDGQGRNLEGRSSGGAGPLGTSHSEPEAATATEEEPPQVEGGNRDEYDVDPINEGRS